MANETDVKSVMVEFNRFGNPGGILLKGTRYIRTEIDLPTREIEVGIGYREFVKYLHALRYPKGQTPDKVDAALRSFQDEAGRMLCDVPCKADETTQIDLVTGAAELKAFPFEAFTKRGVVVTRRIRGNFGKSTSWPAVPKVLFAHAAVGADLPRTLVDEHVAALSQALRPWSGGDENALKKVLVVKEVQTLEALRSAREEAEFTHVHLLAHGIPVDALDDAPLKDWGMRLGPTGSKGVHPASLAKVLEAPNGLPVVVTVASCDSANLSDSAAESFSIAHELHSLGVPVVLASQLPLTMHGSVLLAKSFYEPVLRGVDVRTALDEARESLRGDTKAYHDWVSVVAYVRLPENYADHLRAVALKMELAMLNAAQKRADEVIRANDLAALSDVEVLVRDRVRSLEGRLQNLQEGKDRLECAGLLASAHKRLAELLFLACRPPAEQKLALETALQHYSGAFLSDLNAHWQGVQQLALQAVLHGSVDAADYDIVMRVAQRDAAKQDEYWALGTIAELHLLAPLAGKADAQEKAREAIELFQQRAPATGNAIDSTRRQFRRYVDWWTPPNGFKTDLAAKAAELAALLT